jgi:SAM-dependent methyltransferase
MTAVTQAHRGEGTYPANARLREIWLEPALTWLRAGNHLRQDAAVLDYGCGTGDFAGLIAGEVARADGFDIDLAAVTVAAERFAGRSNFFADPDALPSAAYDLITVASVLQYLRPDELTAFCQRLRRLLKSDPRSFVLITDIIPPEYRSVPDALNSVLVGVRSGAAFAMAGHLLRSVVRMRQTALTMWDSETLARAAGSAGFELTLLPRNLTPSRQRYSCILRPRI